jgi:hypothetical protein
MRVKDIFSPSRFFCQAAVFAFFIGVGYAVIGYDGPASRTPAARVHNQLSYNFVAPAMVRKAGPQPFLRLSPPSLPTDAATRARVIQTITTRPLAFEPNRGQSDGGVKFLSHGGGYALFLTSDGAVFELQESGARSQGKEGKEETQNAKNETGHWRTTRNQGKRITQSVLRMKLVSANPNALVVGVDPLAAKSNYFIGKDPAQWHTDVPNYAKVKYENVYQGVDLVFYGNQRQLEYDFVLAPGADPNVIRLAIDAGRQVGNRQMAGDRSQESETQIETRNSKLETRQLAGQASLWIGDNGDLVIPTEGGEVRFHKPMVYQEKSTVYGGQSTDGARDLARSTDNRQLAIEDRQLLEGHYALAADGTVRFKVPNYDRSKGLTIDPVLSYSTFLGGSNNDSSAGITVDAGGSAYVTGQTFSTNFPTAAPFKSFCGGCTKTSTAFVTKFDSTGATLVYSTYLGGSKLDSAAAVAVDSAGDAYVVGTTLSADFPTTPGAYQATCKSCLASKPDAFVTELNAAGSALVYSTYLGGSQSDQATGVAVEANGSAYVTGTTLSDDFPTASPLQKLCNGCSSGNSDSFVAKFNPVGTNLLYSTFLGGSGIDEGHAIAVDSSGNAYVTGLAGSNDLDTANGFQPFSGGNFDAFVIKLNPAGQGPVYFSYLGGSGNDQGNGIAVDSNGDAYITGSTASKDFPTASPIIGKLGGSQAAFVTKVNRAGSALDFSTYLGGSGTDSGAAIALDSAGNCYVTGSTNSSNFPTVNAIPSTSSGINLGVNQDAFVTKIGPAGAAIIFSTYLGGSDVDAGTGIAVDSFGDAYMSGTTFSGNFPTANAFQTAIGGQFDVIVTKLSGLASPAVTVAPVSLTFSDQPLNTTSAAQTVTLANNGDTVLTINSIAASSVPPSPAQFAETNTCGGNLAAGSSCTISVTFTPTSAGPQHGELTITDDAPGSPQSVPLSGASVKDFSVTASPASQTVNRGTDSTTFTISMASQNGFTGAATLSCQNNASANCTFNPPSITPGQSSTLTVSNLTALSASSLTFSVVGTSGSETAQQSLQIFIPDFSLLVVPATASVNAGQSATYTLSVSPINSFSQLVNLTCIGVPATISCSINPSSVTLDGRNTSTPSVAITTTGPAATAGGMGPLLTAPPSQTPGLRGWFWLLALIMASTLTIARRRVRLRFAVTALFVLLWAACSVGGKTTTGTPSGTYQIQIQGTMANGSLTHSISVGLVVK